MGLAYRVIARLDIKAPNLIKPVQFEGLRVIGNPAEYARKYAEQGADELLYIDCVASLYGRNQLESLIEETSREIFIPINTGGGIRGISCVEQVLKSGADKITLNSSAIKQHSTVRDCALRFGSQCVVISIEAKRKGNGWEAYTEGGRNPSGREVGEWATEAVALGAGEILITSIDRDGTRKGPDFELLAAIEETGLEVPVIYSGGIRLQDVRAVAELSDGMAIGASLHYGDCTIGQIKDALRDYVEIR